MLQPHALCSDTDGSTPEGDHGFHAIEKNETAIVSSVPTLVLVSRYCFYGQRSRTVPRYFPNGRVLNSVREDGGSLRYRSEVSLLVESQLSLDLERLFA